MKHYIIIALAVLAVGCGDDAEVQATAAPAEPAAPVEAAPAPPPEPEPIVVQFLDRTLDIRKLCSTDPEGFGRDYRIIQSQDDDGNPTIICAFGIGDDRASTLDGALHKLTFEATPEAPNTIVRVGYVGFDFGDLDQYERFFEMHTWVMGLEFESDGRRNPGLIRSLRRGALVTNNGVRIAAQNVDGNFVFTARPADKE